MKKFKPIEPSHPYLHETHGNGVWPEGDPSHRLYQPVDAEWPLYDVFVKRYEEGIITSVSRKYDPESWWDRCGAGAGTIPTDLVPVLVDMLNASIRS